MEESLSLLELNHQIKEGLKKHFPSNYWVIAEISELKINRRGHCYLDLIEKDELEDRIVAKARGIIWTSTFRMLKPYFESTTGRELQEGLKVLINVTIEFHELYGYSLNIFDIDPTYTLGDLARKKLETINRLEEEGIYHMNKELPFPVVPQKIAVISSKTAAGYKDFIEQLTHNPYEYKYYTKLFPAYMQGDKAEESIINALEKIFEYESVFDTVAILRGGGAQSDLSCFDLYHLAANVAQFPMPVITGIGHEKDESVVDLVAHTKLKTPTAVADFIINQTYNFEEQLFDLRDHFTEQVNSYLKTEQQRVSNLSYKVVPTAKNILEKNKYSIKLYTNELKRKNQHFIAHQKRQINSQSQRVGNLSKNVIKQVNIYLDLYNQNLIKYVKVFLNDQKQKINTYNKAKNYLDPKNILKRGFSITQADGKVIKSSKEVQEGTLIKTYLSKGKLESKITKSYSDNSDSEK